MKTTIDNYQRVFQIVDSFGRSIFCNFSELQNILIEVNDFCTIYHFWSSKPKKVTKKYYKTMHESNQIEVNKRVLSNLH